MDVGFKPRVCQENDREYYITVISGLLLLGMMNIAIGAYILNTIVPYTTVDPNVYNTTKLVMMVIVTAIGVYGAAKGVMLEGILMILLGISTSAFAAADLMGGSEGLAIMDVLIALVLVLIASGFFLRRDHILFLGTVVVSAAMLLSPVLPQDLGAAALCACTIVAGLLYTAYAVIAWSYANAHKSVLTWISAEHTREYRSLLCTGFSVMTVLMLLLGLYYLNGVFGFMTIDDTAYNFAKIMLSAIVLIICVSYFKEGVFTLGVIYLTFGASTFTFSVCALAQIGGGWEMLDVIMGIVALITALIAFRDKETEIGLISFLIFIALTFYPLFSAGDVRGLLVGLPTFMAAMIVAKGAVQNVLAEVKLYA